MPPQAMSANEPMSNGTWRQDQLPAAALVARGPICIEGRASAQAVKAVKAQWLCTCYTWPGSSWRPSACEADVIATRPQVLMFIMAWARPSWQVVFSAGAPCAATCRAGRIPVTWLLLS